MSQAAKFRFDRFELDPVLGTIMESGTPVRLQPQPFKLLVFLATQSGRLVTRAEIQEHLWGKDTYVDFEASLNFCISQIRSTLADDADSPRFIQTYPKRGYRFIPPIEIVQPEAASHSIQPENNREDAVFPLSHRLHRAFLAAMAALLCVLALAAFWWPFRARTAAAASRTMTSEPQSASTNRAYDAYLEGLYQWHQWTPEGWKRSCEYFHQATENDPRYAPAYAALGNCYRALVGYKALPAQEGYAKAQEAAQKAALLDPNSADAHIALGSNLLTIDWNWPAAHAEFKRALQLNPDHAEAHRAYGTFLRYMGDFDGAIREGKRSEELDPLSNIARLSLCSTYASANKLDQAVDECNRAIKLQPESEGAYVLLSQIFARQHKYDQSAAVTLKALRLEKANVLADRFASSYKKSGYSRAERLLADGMKQQYNDPKAYENQLLFMQMDEKDSAISFLEEAYAAHDSLLLSIKSDPIFAFLHGDPRFEALVSKMHFDSYQSVPSNENGAPL
jgi:DNA-binding winged helix-turn-helix (wHTH) protein/Tfp pilus assembly protein PilF